jgi:energy-coupling factor transport system ATP-binding protein
VLDGISLDIPSGQFVAILGPNGSGKSTLAKHLNVLLLPNEGTVWIDGKDTHAKERLWEIRSQVGMVFQYPEHQLFAETVFEDIAFGPRNKGFAEDEVEKQVREAMAFVGLDYDTYAQRSPFQLSGGQMRRVAIAGVVAMNPDYLVLDEPSAGLDPRSRNAVFKEIMSLHKSRGIAIVLVTHSMEEAVKYADRLLVINTGKVMFDGTPADIFKQHADELVKVGVDVPQVYKLADLLRKNGLAVKENIKDEMSLVKAIKQAKGWK